jgi:class 3 adenylate cyclase
VRELGLEIRAGIHTGECELIGEDLAGLAVHVAARVAATAQPNEVLVSGTVRDLVMGSGVDLVDRGAQKLRGVPGEWRLFVVRSVEGQAPSSEQLSPVQPGLSDRVARLLARRAPGLARAGNRAMRRGSSG